jgi:hypothetical protein
MTPRTSARAAAVALAIAEVGTVQAQTAERPQFRVGDRWEFAVYYSVPTATPSRTWVVTSVSADRVHGTENGEPLVLTADGNVLESPVSASPIPAPRSSRCRPANGGTTTAIGPFTRRGPRAVSP